MSGTHSFTPNHTHESRCAMNMIFPRTERSFLMAGLIWGGGGVSPHACVKKGRRGGRRCATHMCEQRGGRCEQNWSKCGAAKSLLLRGFASDLRSE